MEHASAQMNTLPVLLDRKCGVCGNWPHVLRKTSGKYFVLCSNFDCIVGSPDSVYFDSPYDAAKEWNEREDK